MTITNQTIQQILSTNTKYAQTLLDNVIGLIGKNRSVSMVFHTRFGIHTFGMRFPIDVLILDKTNKIVRIKENLFPNRIFFWNPLYDTVLELPAGTINKTKSELGDLIHFI